MTKTRTFLMAVLAVAVLLLLAAAPMASAQQAAEKPGNVVRVYFTTPKPGAAADYEAGRKRHMEVHKKMGDTWAWYTFQSETGENAGNYSTVTFGHHWADFDEWEKKNMEADLADAAKNLDPHVAGGGNSFYVYLPDVSAESEMATGAEPSPLTELLTFDVKIGGNQEFEDAIKKAHQAIQKTKWATGYSWYVLANGGSGPQYVLAIPLKGYADMEPSAMPFPVMLEKGLGPAAAKTVIAALDKTIARQSSVILRYRPDLSYVPAK